jgi:hypothetical protein
LQSPGGVKRREVKLQEQQGEGGRVKLTCMIAVRRAVGLISPGNQMEYGKEREGLSVQDSNCRFL